MGKEYFCELTRVAEIIAKPVSWLEYKVETNQLRSRRYKGERFILTKDAKALYKSLLKQETPEKLKDSNWCAGFSESRPDVYLLEFSKKVDTSAGKRKSETSSKKRNSISLKANKKTQTKTKWKVVKQPEFRKTLRESPEETRERQARNAAYFEKFKSSEWYEPSGNLGSPIRTIRNKRYWWNEED